MSLADFYGLALSGPADDAAPAEPSKPERSQEEEKQHSRTALESENFDSKVS